MSLRDRIGSQNRDIAESKDLPTDQEKVEGPQMECKTESSRPRSNGF